MTPDAIDRRLIARLCGDLGDSPTPFRDLAAELGIATDDVLARLRRYRAGGALRRFGAILRHQRAGFTANGMSVWHVPAADIDRVGGILAACTAVSHAYQRPPLPDWPYNVFGMIHGRSEDECLQTAKQLSEAIGISDYRVLFSRREFKKSSMVYFAEASGGQEET